MSRQGRPICGGLCQTGDKKPYPNRNRIKTIIAVGTFNEALGNGPVVDWPMINPGSIQAAILLVWQHGPGAMITKADISNAYKVRNKNTE